MAQFLLTLFEDPSAHRELSPTEMQGMLQEYGAWAKALQDEGRLLGGEKLTDEGGRVLTSHKGDIRVTDGPYAETKEVLGGYFVIEAADYDDAVELAKGCPHTRYGGAIHVRAIDDCGANPNA